MPSRCLTMQRRSLCTGTILLVLFLFANLAHAQKAKPTTLPYEYPEAQPLHRITFPDNPWIGKCVFSKDGERLFVHAPNTAINIWEIFIYYWPETLGSAFVLTAFVSLLALRRIAHTKRLPGELHCRNCNYCLKNVPTDRRPECGRIIHRPIKGRSQRIRMLPWTLILSIAIVAYGGLWALRMPRSGWLSNYFTWWSKPLLKWATDQNIAWLTARVQNIDEIVEYGVLSGTKRRVLITLPMQMRMRGYDLALTPDGKGLIIPIQWNDSLAIVSTESGKIIKTFSCPEIATTKGTRWRQIAGFDDAGETVYATALDEKNGETKLVAWNWEKKQYQFLLKTKAILGEFTTGKLWQARHFLRIPNSGPLRFLEVPSFIETETFPPKVTKLFVHDLVTHDQNPPAIPVLMRNFQDPIFSPDGSHVLVGLRKNFSRGLDTFDLRTGKPADTIHIPWNYFFNDRFKIDSVNKRLIVGARVESLRASSAKRSAGEKFFVQDLASGRWIGRYVSADTWVSCEDLVLSPDGRFFATLGFNEKNSAGKFVHELWIYDLRILH